MFAVRSRRFPDVIEHAVIQFSEVRFFERDRRFQSCDRQRPIVAPTECSTLRIRSTLHGADAENQLFGLLRTNGCIPVGLFMVEDEVHFDLSFKRRWTSSSISWLAFSGFWSSSAMV